MNFYFKFYEVLLLSLGLILMGFSIDKLIQKPDSFIHIYVVLSILFSSLTFLIRARNRARLIDKVINNDFR